MTKLARFKARLMIANACFMAILSYMIVIWGESEIYILKVMQVIQNKAAHLVTRQSWYIPTWLLLLQCNWLSIKQMVFFHTALQKWKIRSRERPACINEQLMLPASRA